MDKQEQIVYESLVEELMSLLELSSSKAGAQPILRERQPGPANSNVAR